MISRYGNAPIPEGFQVWVAVRLKPNKAYNAVSIDSSCVLSGTDMKKVWQYMLTKVDSIIAGYTYPNEIGICMCINKQNVDTQGLMADIVSLVSVKANQVHFAKNPMGFVAGKVRMIPAAGRLYISTSDEDVYEVMPSRKLEGLMHDIVTIYRKTTMENGKKKQQGKKRKKRKMEMM